MQRGPGAVVDNGEGDCWTGPNRVAGSGAETDGTGIAGAGKGKVASESAECADVVALRRIEWLFNAAQNGMEVEAEAIIEQEVEVGANEAGFLVYRAS